MRLPPGRASTFEAAGKQGCDCVAWSRKRRTSFSSRQGVYESPVPRPMPDYGTKCPSWIATLTKKRTDFLLKIGMGGKAILGFSRLDCPSAKTGRTVNGGTLNVPFILTVDWLGWLCYFPDKMVFIAQIRQKLFTCSKSIFKSC